MLDRQKRPVDYLRISVTDRCNLRCIYCMPPEGVEYKPHAEILRYEEIIRVVAAGAALGIKRVRLTGGEPLVRKGLTALIGSLAAIEGIEDISLTTNGTLLGPLAAELKEAGLGRVNISLDTLDPRKFRLVTRGGELERVWDGIEQALKLGLNPVKINVVVIKGLNDGELADFARLTREAPLHVRFIELMPLGDDREWANSHRLSLPEQRRAISHLGPLEPVQIPGGGPAQYYRLPGGKGSIGFISALSEHFCARCNRLRLTADGKVRPCLASDQELDLKCVLRAGGDTEAIREILVQAVNAKPVGHRLEVQAQDETGGKRYRYMCQIGG